jgi:hypothetical protein
MLLYKQVMTAYQQIVSWQHALFGEALLLLPRIPIQSFGDTLDPVLATSVVG